MSDLALTLPPEFVERIAERAAELVAERSTNGAEPWIGVEQAAEHLACAKHRIYALVHQRAIPFRKEGARLLFRRSELDASLDEGGAARPGVLPPVANLAERPPAERSRGETGRRPLLRPDRPARCRCRERGHDDTASVHRCGALDPDGSRCRCRVRGEGGLCYAHQHLSPAPSPWLSPRACGCERPALIETRPARAAGAAGEHRDHDPKGR